MFQTLCLILALVQSPPMPAQIEAPTPSLAPARIVRTPYLTRKGFVRSSLHIELQNDSARIIESVEIQFDVIDRLRKTLRDRLFLTMDAPGMGRWHGIKPNKSSTIELTVDYEFPDGVGDGYGTYWCTGCTVINVVHFKDGSKWERKGWRDESNPNR